MYLSVWNQQNSIDNCMYVGFFFLHLSLLFLKKKVFFFGVYDAIHSTHFSCLPST
jgi:hypothetical protein